MEAIDLAIAATGTIIAVAIALVARWWLLAFVVALMLFAHGDDKRTQNLGECRIAARRSLARDELASNMGTDHRSTGYILVQTDDSIRDCMGGKGYDLDLNRCPASPRDDLLTTPAWPECFSRTWGNTLAAQVR